MKRYNYTINDFLLMYKKKSVGNPINEPIK